MELCTTELTNVKKLSPQETSKMIRETAVVCDKRKDDIEKMIKSTKLDCDPILKNYGINIKFDMANLNGRVLAAPDLVYKNTTTKDIGNKGQWDNMNKVFFETKELGDWILINGGRTLKNDKDVDNFIYTIQDVAWNHGIEIKDPLEVIPIRYADERKSREVLDYAYKRYKNLKFIMAILPGTSIFYSLIIFFNHAIFKN